MTLEHLVSEAEAARTKAMAEKGGAAAALATAGVRDCPDVVSSALAAVAASTNTNAIANVDMTGRRAQLSPSVGVAKVTYPFLRQDARL